MMYIGDIINRPYMLITRHFIKKVDSYYSYIRTEDKILKYYNKHISDIPDIYIDNS